jgi:hypothetical protein
LEQSVIHWNHHLFANAPLIQWSFELVPHPPMMVNDKSNVCTWLSLVVIMLVSTSMQVAVNRLFLKYLFVINIKSFLLN